MFIVDDPMLALITRFVFNVEQLDVPDADFLRRQVECIREYVERYPAQQQERKALEWIEKHSKKYRQDWQKRMISERISGTRCADCPLIGSAASIPCEIHGHWLRLLKDYLAQKITSKTYVEETLILLKAHKTKLKVASILSPT